MQIFNTVTMKGIFCRRILSRVQNLFRFFTIFLFRVGCNLKPPVYSSRFIIIQHAVRYGTTSSSILS